MGGLSKGAWLNYKDGVLVALDIKHSGDLDVEELLDFVNDVDMNALMYNAVELRSKTLEKVQLKKQLLKQWNDDEMVVQHLVHPDSYFSIKDIEIDNTVLTEEGYHCCLKDGFYKMFYLGQSSIDLAVRSTISEGATINESFILPTLRVQEELCETEPDCMIVSWFYYCDGLIILVDQDNHGGIEMLKTLEESLKLGNLLLVNDKNKSMLHFIFTNKVREVSA